jgi:hypothetical protein
MEQTALMIERRGDGAILVRVASRERNGQRLPDAVFAFRSGDPQYHFWEQQFALRANVMEAR